MSALDILANMKRGWNRDPAGHAVGTARTGVSAALWRNERDDVQEVSGEPDVSQHIVCVKFAMFHAQMMIDGRRVFAGQCRPGMITIVRAGDRPRAITKGAFSILHFYVPHELLAAYAEADGLGLGPALEIADPNFAFDRRIEAIAREVQLEMRQAAPLSRLRVDALGQDLGVQLLRRHSNLAGNSAVGRAARGGLAPWQVRRACDAMEASLDGSVGLDMLAGLAGVSSTHFSRAFKQTMGVPPFAWLLGRRIERAKELLANPRVPLAEVALAVGFSAQPQFTTAFRRLTGVTPGAWRRERPR